VSPIEYLRHLTTADSRRWQPMLAGLALFAAGVGAAVFLEVSDLVAALLTGLALAAWAMGACALVGYVRWMFASDLARAEAEKKAKR
jgi:hypothetical protein